MSKVYISAVLNFPVDEVWAYLRDYSNLSEWHPGIAKCYMEGGKASDQVGAVRVILRHDGATLRETLLSFSDIDRTFTYDIVKSQLPLRNYIATLSCKPVTEGGMAFIEWQATYDTTPEHEKNLEENVGRNTFAVGLTALAEKFKTR